MATKYSIAEQVQLRISQGYSDNASPVQIDDLILAVGQKANQLLKAQFLGNTLPSGDTIPDGLMLAVYNNIPVTRIGAKSYSVLPVMPIFLPKNMGVYEVSDMIDFSNLFIPLMNGQTFLIQSQPLISNLLGQVGYEVVSNQLVYNRDITVSGVTSVNMKLVVTDISRLGNYDVLPIAADMEGAIIEYLIQQFAPFQTNSDKVDNYSTQGNQIQQQQQQQQQQ